MPARDLCRFKSGPRKLRAVQQPLRSARPRFRHRRAIAPYRSGGHPLGQAQAPCTPGCTTIGTVIAARAGQAGSPLDGGGAVLQLYSYFRSSASCRVRIALNLKGLDYETVAVHLLKGEQRAEGFLAVNPAGLVPALVEEGKVFTQSLAIIEYLDEAHPGPSLLPGDAADRARLRPLAP